MHNAVRHSLRTLVAAGVVSGGVFAVGAVPTSAAVPISCNAGANTDITVNPLTHVATWTITGGGGSCDANDSTRTVSFSGSGTSQGIGACSNDPGTANLLLTMTVKIHNTTTGVDKQFTETWAAAQTNFPGTTPFQITGDMTGSGTIFLHIFGKCPPDGTPSTKIYWSQSD